MLCLDSVFGIDGLMVREFDCVNDGSILGHLRHRPHVTVIVDKGCLLTAQVDNYKHW